MQFSGMSGAIPFGSVLSAIRAHSGTLSGTVSGLDEGPGTGSLVCVLCLFGGRWSLGGSTTVERTHGFIVVLRVQQLVVFGTTIGSIWCEL